MNLPRPFTCSLIGADNLLIQCAELLLQRGHGILNVISASPVIVAWAQKKGIAVIDERGDIAAALADTTFDYLFSITHLAMIPERVLALPDKAAINFHDGPLPRYAGLNTPVWALLNGEKSHGITWHLITSGPDRGNILMQKTFALSPDETALSLNTRCFEAALETFGDLVDELGRGEMKTHAQDFSQRAYFSRLKRPPNACAIDWKRPAAELETQVRALDFGPYLNPIGWPCFLAGESLYALNRAEVRPSDLGACPGEVLAIADDHLLVATGEGGLALLGITTPEGEPVTANRLTKLHRIDVGDRLPGLTAEFAASLTKANRRWTRSEPFWVNRLMRLEPIEFPLEPIADKDSQESESFERPVGLEIPPTFCAKFPDLAPAVMAAFAAFAARLGQKTRFNLGYVDARQAVGDADLAAWCSNWVPMLVDLTPRDPFAAPAQSRTKSPEGPQSPPIDSAAPTGGGILEKVERELETLAQHGSFRRDAVGRTPALRDNPDLKNSPVLSVGIARVGASPRSLPLPAGQILSLLVEGDDRFSLRYDRERLIRGQAEAICARFELFLDQIAAHPEVSFTRLDLLTGPEKNRILFDWNPKVSPCRVTSIHRLIAEQAGRTPNAPAVAGDEQCLTYRELDKRAEVLAHRLRGAGLGQGKRAGILLERSHDLPVALHAVLKTGAAYVPMDPAYPAERIAFMMADSGIAVLITHPGLEQGLPGLTQAGIQIVFVSEEGNPPAGGPVSTCEDYSTNDASELATDLAYVIYTSGSTGKPKGVMVSHANAVNFFHGMDEQIPHQPGDTWFAVTSLSFDISILELLWTLSRGFKVVISGQRAKARPVPEKGMDFSFFYFSSNEEEEGKDKYRLLIEGARFADQHGFSAIWTPERHFHAFGGLYPNPAVSGAAIATITRNIQIRAGSVVLPLHHPVRVAEAWAMVDNFSGGRVGLSFASGWQPNDFILRPESFADAKGTMFRDIEIVKKLWRGEVVEFPGATEKKVAIRTLPRPVQPELPVWVTTAGNIETYRQAGEIGANLLTHLLGQSIEEMAPKIAAYRAARAEHGHDPGGGIVSLMLHAFLGDDEEVVRNCVREPMKQYLGSSLNLLKKYAWAFPAFTRPSNLERSDDDFAELDEDSREAMLEHAFQRYYETSGLFGRPEDCLTKIERLKSVGVDEIACLIDFGVPTERVIAHFPHFDHLRQLANQSLADRAPETAQPQSAATMAALFDSHQPTHLQCTPSMAAMLALQADWRSRLGRLECLLIGGETFPDSLARDLKHVVKGRIANMYGPTETTIWSAVQQLDSLEAPIPIGRPISNTQLFVLDRWLNPVPAGLPGELFIGGEGVARGYHGRPGLTAQRFIADPFAGRFDKRGGSRLYRTGDLVRYRLDGVLEFLGRIDQQVKIRGFRIELGEIESCLNRFTAIRESVVVAREDRPGDVRLIAFIVPQGAKPGDEALRAHLRLQMPEFMVPAHFVALEGFPQTPNRKVDRKALSREPGFAPERRQATEKPYVPPQNELEQTIAAVWCEMLGREQIGVDDNFFDSGGNSFLVVRLHRRLSQVLEKRVQVTELYRFPTIRKLSNYFSDGGGSAGLKASSDRAQRRRQMRTRGR